MIVSLFGKPITRAEYEKAEMLRDAYFKQQDRLKLEHDLLIAPKLVGKWFSSETDHSLGFESYVRIVSHDAKTKKFFFQRISFFCDTRWPDLRSDTADMNCVVGEDETSIAFGGKYHEVNASEVIERIRKAFQDLTGELNL